MFTDRGMDKEDVCVYIYIYIHTHTRIWNIYCSLVFIYNGILFSHRKERNNAICSASGA